MRVKRLLLLLTAAVPALACQDEGLRTLTPRIALCPEASSAESACDERIELGDVVVGKKQRLEVFIKNRGDGRLAVRDAAVDDDAITIDEPPTSVDAGGSSPLVLMFELPFEALGDGEAALTVESDDPDNKSASVTLAWTAIPPPAGSPQFCDGEAEDAVCSAALDVDLGVVRPSQATSVALFLLNAGDADLEVEGLTLEGGSEIVLDSSGSGGVLAPGERVPVIVLYAPEGAGEDEATLTALPVGERIDAATAFIHGSSSENLPPVGAAADSVTGTTSASVRVGEAVGAVSTGSLDPEGDPLSYAWTLVTPAGSAASLDDATAENAVFVPDVRGTFSLTLVVADSLGQTAPPVTITVEATARYAFRARARWDAGGDVDLHVVESGSSPFSARDCRWDNRTLDGGDGAATLDDLVLLDDATSGPGAEDAAIEAPLAGTWELWAHVFEDADLGAVDVTIDVILNDDATPAFTVTRTLDATCALWHAATVTLPAGTTVDPAAATQSFCP